MRPTRVSFYSRVAAAESRLFKPLVAVVPTTRALHPIDRQKGPVDRLLAHRKALRAIKETIGR